MTVTRESYTLMLGDCTERMREIPDVSVDMVLTSPPYDNLRTYNGSLNWSFEIFQLVAEEIYRVLAPGGVCVWVVGDATIDGGESGTSFMQALHFKEIGMRIHDTMIYEKQNPVPSVANRYQPSFEYMFLLSKGKPKVFNPMVMPTKGINGGSKQRLVDGTTRKFNSGSKCKPTKFRKNIWQYSVGADRFGHPAPFPLQLALDHIASWSNPGDTVLDPFLGSGTSGVAALQLGRRFIGIEKEPNYFAIASKRLARAEYDIDLQALEAELG